MTPKINFFLLSNIKYFLTIYRPSYAWNIWLQMEAEADAKAKGRLSSATKKCFAEKVVFLKSPFPLRTNLNIFKFFPWMSK
jgi:hypothetical protein